MLRIPMTPLCRIRYALYVRGDRYFFTGGALGRLAPFGVTALLFGNFAGVPLAELFPAFRDREMGRAVIQCGRGWLYLRQCWRSWAGSGDNRCLLASHEAAWSLVPPWEQASRGLALGGVPPDLLQQRWGIWR